MGFKRDNDCRAFCERDCHKADKCRPLAVSRFFKKKSNFFEYLQGRYYFWDGINAIIFPQLLGTSTKKVWNYKLTAFTREIMQVKSPQESHIARAVLLRFYKDKLDRGDQFWHLVSSNLVEFNKLDVRDQEMYAPEFCELFFPFFSAWIY